MLSEEQRTSITAVFASLDATHDGLISRDDATMRANQVCAAVAPDEASESHRDIQTAYGRLWEELMRYADAEGDGTLTLDEFLDAVDRGMLEDPEFVEGCMLVVSHAVFAAADRDGDGSISREEYALAVTSIDEKNAELADAGFAMMDRDGDGLISRDELLQAIRDAFSSSEPAEGFGARVFR